VILTAKNTFCKLDVGLEMGGFKWKREGGRGHVGKGTGWTVFQWGMTQMAGNIYHGDHLRLFPRFRPYQVYQKLI
jgi:hypothetical protein